jgi:hypothetical protein
MQRAHGWLAWAGRFVSPQLPSPSLPPQPPVRRRPCLGGRRAMHRIHGSLASAALRPSPRRSSRVSSMVSRCCRIDGPQTTRHASDNKVRCALAADARLPASRSLSLSHRVSGGLRMQEHAAHRHSAACSQPWSLAFGPSFCFCAARRPSALGPCRRRLACQPHGEVLRPQPRWCSTTLTSQLVQLWPRRTVRPA